MNTIDAFKKTWPQRKATDNIESLEDMERFIVIELKDELTHPRVRKTKQQKLDLAMQRIGESELAPEEKQHLIETYKKIAAQMD